MVGNIYKNNYNSNSIALKFKGNNVTYEKLDQIVKGYAAYFKALGLKIGKKVILSCPNSPEFIYSYLGVVKNGGIIVPINLMLTIEEITYLIKDSDADFMVIHPMILHKAKLTKESIADMLGINIIVLDENFQKSISEVSTEGLEDFSDENAVSTFLYTSGTTGKQKAAMLTHKNLVLNAEQSRLAFHGTAADNIMCVLPMFHVFAFTACVLNALWSGATITILEKFQPKEVVESLLRDDITIFMGVPAMYVILLGASKDNIVFPKLRLAVSGGAALPVEVFRQAKTILKAAV